jgi:hypothetical protein
MRSQRKEHSENLRGPMDLTAEKCNWRQAELHNEVLPNDRMLGAEAGPFCKASESYEIKNSQQSF